MTYDEHIETEKQTIRERIESSKEKIDFEVKKEDTNFAFIDFLMSAVANDLKLLALMNMHHITLIEARKILSDITFPKPK